MNSISDFRTRVLGMSKGGIPVEDIDAFAVELTSLLVDHDATIAERFEQGVTAAAYTITDYQVAHLAPFAAEIIRKRYGTGSVATINQIVSKCLNLAIYIARGEA